MLGKLIVEGATVELPWFDPNTLNLVAEVSTKVIVITTTTHYNAKMLFRRRKFTTWEVIPRSAWWTVGSK